MCFHTRNSFAFFNSNIIHVEADDFALFRDKHYFIVVMNNFNGNYVTCFVRNLEVLRAFTAAFLQCISFRIIAFTKSFFGDSKHLCFTFISINNTSTYNHVACIEFNAPHAVSRTFHKAYIAFTETNSDTQFSTNQDILVTSRYVDGNQVIPFVEVDSVEARTTDVAVFFDSCTFYNAELSYHE